MAEMGTGGRRKLMRGTTILDLLHSTGKRSERSLLRRNQMQQNIISNNYQFIRQQQRTQGKQ
jgi:hypothetical protein